MKRKYTEEQDTFLRKNIRSSYTLYDLTDSFNATFPEHHTNVGNIQKRLKKLGLKKGTHNIRLDHRRSYNTIGTVISDKNGKKARVKTDKGYVCANTYFKLKYLGKNDDNKMIVHLNGELNDFTRENIIFVNKNVWRSLQWRKWFFNDNIELQKTAVLAAELILLLPEISKNENQFLSRVK